MSLRTCFSLLFVGVAVCAQAQTKPEETEVWTPVPPVVSSKAVTVAPPSDAIVLFNGKNLDNWVSVKSKAQAPWTVANGAFTVKGGTGNIETKQSFTNYQLHIEWFIPDTIKGSGQGRGNSGVFLASTGNGDLGYEIQVLDSYGNKTYSNGQAASMYKQFIPLANATAKPGEWQSYDIVWTAPTFNTDGSLKTPARITAFHNGVLVQNNVELKGFTVYIGQPMYKPHGASPIKLQDHGDPVSFRNIWVRELK